jgi:MinD-like ATPase involved in chromosome partitioning or flagellar assembly
MSMNVRVSFDDLSLSNGESTDEIEDSVCHISPGLQLLQGSTRIKEFANDLK